MNAARGGVGGYLLARLALALPTTLAILFVVFALANLAPALPEGAGEGEPEVARESLRAFREHYGLELPLVLNLRGRLTRDDLAPRLARAAGSGPSRIGAEDEILDLGRHAAVPLAALAGDPKLASAQRDVALSLLPRLVRRPISPRDTAELVASKAEDNAIARRLEPRSGSLDGAEQERLAAEWTAFLAARPERFPATPGLDPGVMFLETRIARYLANLARLDFGASMVDQQPVLPVFLRRLARSFWIGLAFFVVTFAAAIPLGLFSAWLSRRGAVLGRALWLLLYALYSIPHFFLATVLIEAFAAGRPFSWFPPGGFASRDDLGDRSALAYLLDVAHHLALPVLCLSLASTAALARLLHGSLLDALRTDFMRAARAKGLTEGQALRRHALRVALLPLATVAGNFLPVLIGGSAVVEYLFDIPGVGLYLLEAVLRNDFNVILAVTLLAALATQLGYLISDFLYGMLDPRVRLARAA
jgi:ABC-type dipeptide/oligopeptide/nickel transport system permease component